ncbi:hypothetical protein BRD02_13170 [Halobacteriales archaeon QS_8_69_73]|nr:MAG: hypothetical protein BRD02_13170 [Halobacteriales archaeon QS_8_69_73]
MFDYDEDGVSRRSILRSAAAGTAGMSLVGSASGQEVVPDDPAPGPNVTFFGYDCDPDRDEFYTEVSREPTHDFGESEVIELDSGRDGEKIQLAVTWPAPLDDAEPSDDYPVILRATPYVSDLRGYTVRDCIRTRRLAENYIQQGYAVAAVAVRGTGGSGGCMELMGPNEQADIDQAVTRLGKDSRSNGNVAIIGRSYDGTTPWMPARKGNPYLATVVPFSGVPDIHELMYKRGSPETRGYAILNGLYYIISLAEHGPNSGTGLRTYLSRASCPDNLRRQRPDGPRPSRLERRPLAGVPLDEVPAGGRHQDPRLLRTVRPPLPRRRPHQERRRRADGGVQPRLGGLPAEVVRKRAEGS